MTIEALNTPFSPFAQFINEKRGLEISISGKPITKYAAFRLKERGLIYCQFSIFNVVEREKPGWIDGELVDIAAYDDYLETL